MASTGESDAASYVRIASEIVWFDVLESAGAHILTRDIALYTNGLAG